jgi:uncharacterized membrane protein YqjE
MANQATMTGNGHAAAARCGGRESSPVSHIAYDVLELSELQGRLALLDLEDSTARIRNALIFIAAGAIVLWMACLIGLVTAAYALVEVAGWDRWMAFGAVALGALVLSLLLLFVAWRCWRRGLFTWDRSRDELHKNLTWLKAALSGQHAAYQRPSQSAYHSTYSD